ncbi:hypothetical protein [Streptomyces sp. NPDC007205]|uniref:hypothetical protein n=1 Tax=Streptomyces sp. NPDC007205 TaxID=3154316 RepID=UPI003403FB6E
MAAPAPVTKNDRALTLTGPEETNASMRDRVGDEIVVRGTRPRHLVNGDDHDPAR